MIEACLVGVASVRRLFAHARGSVGHFEEPRSRSGTSEPASAESWDGLGIVL